MGILTEDLKLTGNKGIYDLTGLKKHSQNVRYKVGDKVFDQQGCICIKDHISITPYLNQFDGNWKRIGDERKFQIQDAPCFTTRGNYFFAQLPPIYLTNNFTISFYINDHKQSEKGSSCLIGGTLNDHKNIQISYNNIIQRFVISDLDQDQYNLSEKISEQIREKLFESQEYIFVQIKRIGAELSIFIDGIDCTSKENHNTHVTNSNFSGEFIVTNIGRGNYCKDEKMIGLNGLHSLSVLNNEVLEAFFPLQGDLKDIIGNREGVIVKTDTEVVENHFSAKPDLEHIELKDYDVKETVHIERFPCLSLKEYGVVANLISITLEDDFEISFYLNNKSPLKDSIRKFSTIIDGYLTRDGIRYKRGLVSFDNRDDHLFEESLTGEIGGTKAAPDELFKSEKYSAFQINRRGGKLSILINKKLFLESKIDDWDGGYTINAIGRADREQAGIFGIHSLTIRDQSLGKNILVGSYLLQGEVMDLISGKCGSINQTRINQISVDKNKGIFIGPIDTKHIGIDLTLKEKTSHYVKDNHCLSTRKTGTFITLSPIDDPLLLKGDFTISFYLNNFSSLNGATSLRKEELDNDLISKYTTIIDGEFRWRQRALLSYNDQTKRFCEESLRQDIYQEIEDPVALYKTNKYFLVEITRVEGLLKVFINGLLFIQSLINDWQGDYKVLAIGRNKIGQEGISGIHSLKIIDQSEKDKVIGFFHLQGDLTNLINNKDGKASRTLMLNEEIKNTRYWEINSSQMTELIDSKIDLKYFTETDTSTNIGDHTHCKGFQIYVTKDCILDHLLVNLNVREAIYGHYFEMPVEYKTVTLYLCKGGEDFFDKGLTVEELNKSELCYSETIDLTKLPPYSKEPEERDVMLELGFKIQCNLEIGQLYFFLVGYPNHTCIPSFSEAKVINPFFNTTHSISVSVSGDDLDNTFSNLKWAPNSSSCRFTFGIIEPSITPLFDNKEAKYPASLFDMDPTFYFEQPQFSNTRVITPSIFNIPNKELSTRDSGFMIRLVPDDEASIILKGDFIISFYINDFDPLLDLTCVKTIIDGDHIRAEKVSRKYIDLIHGTFISEDNHDEIESSLLSYNNITKSFFIKGIDNKEISSFEAPDKFHTTEQFIFIEIKKEAELLRYFINNHEVTKLKQFECKGGYKIISIGRDDPEQAGLKAIHSLSIKDLSRIGEQQVGDFPFQGNIKNSITGIEGEMVKYFDNILVDGEQLPNYMINNFQSYKGKIDKAHAHFPICFIDNKPIFILDNQASLSTIEPGTIVNLDPIGEKPIILNNDFTISFYINLQSPFINKINKELLVSDGNYSIENTKRIFSTIIDGELEGKRRALLSYNNKTNKFFEEALDLDIAKRWELPKDLSDREDHLFVKIERIKSNLQINIFEVVKTDNKEGNFEFVKKNISTTDSQLSDWSGSYKVTHIGRDKQDQAGIAGIHSLKIVDSSEGQDKVKAFFHLQGSIKNIITGNYGQIQRHFKIVKAEMLSSDPEKLVTSLYLEHLVVNADMGGYGKIGDQKLPDTLTSLNTRTNPAVIDLTSSQMILKGNFTVSFFINDKDPIIKDLSEEIFQAEGEIVTKKVLRKYITIIDGVLIAEDNKEERRALFSYDNCSKIFFWETIDKKIVNSFKVPVSFYETNSYLFIEIKRIGKELKIFIDGKESVQSQPSNWTGEYKILSIGRDDHKQAGIRGIHSLMIIDQSGDKDQILAFYHFQKDVINLIDQQKAKVASFIQTNKLKTKTIIAKQGLQTDGRFESLISKGGFNMKQSFPSERLVGQCVFVKDPKILKKLSFLMRNSGKPLLNVFEKKQETNSIVQGGLSSEFSRRYHLIYSDEFKNNNGNYSIDLNIFLKPGYLYVISFEYDYDSSFDLFKQSSGSNIQENINLSDSGLYWKSGVINTAKYKKINFKKREERSTYDIETDCCFTPFIFGQNTVISLEDVEHKILEYERVPEFGNAVFSGITDLTHKNTEVFVAKEPLVYEIKDSKCFSTRENGAVAHLVPFILSGDFTISFYINDFGPISDPNRKFATIIGGKLNGIERDLISYDNNNRSFFTEFATDGVSYLTQPLEPRCFDDNSYLFIYLKRSSGKLSISINGIDKINDPGDKDNYWFGEYLISSIGKKKEEQAGIKGIHSLTIKELVDGQYVTRAFYPLEDNILDLVSKKSGSVFYDNKSASEIAFTGFQSEDCYPRNRGPYDLILQNKSLYDPYIPLKNISATSELQSEYSLKFVFDLNLSPVGKAQNNSWRAYPRIDQRLCVKIAGYPCTLKGVKYINYHDQGGDTDIGVKNIKIYGVTSNEVPSAIYDQILKGYELLFDGELMEHQNANVADWHALEFIPTNNRYNYLIFDCKDNHGNDLYIGLRSLQIIHHNDFFWGDNKSAIGSVIQSNENILFEKDGVRMRKEGNNLLTEILNDEGLWVVQENE